jgi:hypothetical protein
LKTMKTPVFTTSILSFLAPFKRPSITQNW